MAQSFFPAERPSQTAAVLNWKYGSRDNSGSKNLIWVRATSLKDKCSTVIWNSGLLSGEYFLLHGARKRTFLAYILPCLHNPHSTFPAANILRLEMTPYLLLKGEFLWNESRDQPVQIPRHVLTLHHIGCPLTVGPSETTWMKGRFTQVLCRHDT